MNVRKNIRLYKMYYGNKEDESEIENINEINENVADKNLFEINGYYINKTGKYYKNYNLIFGSGNKFH
jgi:hypothetical protein